MAGKKDIVEQALKLVVGSGEKVAPKVRTIRNLKGVPIAPPVEFYRGTNPGSTERIVTGAPEWDSYLFAADNPDAARLYGSEIEKITANPDAKILYEGTADWNKIAGRWRKNENMLQYADRAAKAAKEAGYDAAWFKRQSDIGTPIFNVEKFIRGQKAEGGSVREGYAGKGRVVKGVVDKAIGLIERLDPKSDEWAANLDRFYKGTPSEYRRKYYTGTSKDKDFTAFQESRHGTWLTANPEEASDYAIQNDSQSLRLIPGTWKYEPVNSASRVIPAYARIENPYRGELPDFARVDNYKKAQSDWFDTLRAQGYDAWVPESRKGEAVVILKDQGRAVKSAIGNTGYFDPNVKHMGKSEGGEVDPYADEVASAKAAMAEKQYSEQPWSEWAGDVVGNAVNTAKAILPTALGGEGSVGVTDIARGAYEGAKDAVKFPGDVLTGKQALYDESGRPLEGAVGRSLNTVGAVGGASSLVPVPSNSLRVFGGSRSRTADKNALTQAQILESQAADRDAIWRQSGWGRGAEGRWRYEIPDVGTTVDPSKFNLDLSSTAIPSSMVTTLGEYINHPELFDAYPEFKTMPVKGYYDPNSNVSGYYMPRYSRGTINPGFSDPYIALNLSHLPTVEAQRATLLHEIQHAIQQKEGFVPGTNVASRPLQTANPLYAFYKDALKTEPELQELEALRATDAFKAEQAEKQVLFAEFQKKIQELDERQAATGVSTKQEYVDAVNDYMKKTEGRFPLAVKAARLGFDLEDRGIPSSEPPEFLDQEGAYLADAGEVESRNVQNRKDAPREELKERPPWRTQDRRYPYEGQIIDWNNTSWRKGYSVGGASDSDRDIESAMMIAGAR